LAFHSLLGEGVAAYVPVAHDYLDAPDQIPRERVLALLKPLLEDEKVLKVGQNLKYDRGILQTTALSCAGSPSTPCWNPTFWIAWRAAMIWILSDRWLKHKTITFEEIAGKGKISSPLTRLRWKRLALRGGRCRRHAAAASEDVAEAAEA
jgi:DNA polymerase-1